MRCYAEILTDIKDWKPVPLKVTSIGVLLLYFVSKDAGQTEGICDVGSARYQ